MCLSIPGKILKVKKNKALVDFLGQEKEVDISLVFNIKKGDYLFVKENLAINKLENKEAKDILKTIKKCKHKH